LDGKLPLDEKLLDFYLVIYGAVSAFRCHKKESSLHVVKNQNKGGYFN